VIGVNHAVVIVSKMLRMNNFFKNELGLEWSDPSLRRHVVVFFHAGL